MPHRRRPRPGPMQGDTDHGGVAIPATSDATRAAATSAAATSAAATSAAAGRAALALALPSSRRRSLSVAGGAQWDMRARLVNRSRRISQPPDLATWPRP